MSDPAPPRRPRDLALLLLAAAVGPPRRRARDQQADHAGEGLRRRVLERIVATDPDPEDLEAALARLVDELGEPTGPARAACIGFRDEWHDARSTPGLLPWLLAEAVAGGRGGGRAGPRGRDDVP